MNNSFIPHAACTVASGDCFTLGKCLASCRARQTQDHEKRIKELEKRLVVLETALIDLKHNRK